MSGYEIGLLAEHLQLMGKARVVAKILIGQKKKKIVTFAMLCW